MDSEALAAAISEWRERRATMRDEDDERLWRKLRLEWNYNSNHIEGNTLTYHETELLLIHGRTAGEHPMRHYEEMKAHDVAIDHTRHLASAERVLGEGDIRDLNKILLKEPFWHVAQTPDGQQTRKRIVPGEYKTQPNHVRTATGELHRFAEPEETPALMQAWVSDFRGDLRDSELSASRLPEFLAQSHWGFLRIHPFDDGNGRTARLLTNYVLLRSGLPPMVIKSAERDRYIGALQNADLGRMAPLAEFMLENTLWSLGLATRAAKGESIRESEDVEKEVQLFVRRNLAGAPTASDGDVLGRVVHRWIRPMLKRAGTAFEPLGRLFQTNRWMSSLKPSRGGSEVSGDGLFDRWTNTRNTYVATRGFQLTDLQEVELRSSCRWALYRGSGERGFSVELALVWRLGEGVITFLAQIDGEPVPDSLQRVPFSELETGHLEVNRAVDLLGQVLLTEIERRSGERE